MFAVNTRSLFLSLLLASPIFALGPAKSKTSFTGTWRPYHRSCSEDASFQVSGDSVFYTDRNTERLQLKGDRVYLGEEGYLYQVGVDTLLLRPLGDTSAWLYINRKCDSPQSYTMPGFTPCTEVPNQDPTLLSCGKYSVFCVSWRTQREPIYG